MRERERETEGARDRQTDRQRGLTNYRETEKQRQRQTDRQRGLTVHVR